LSRGLSRHLSSCAARVHDFFSLVARGQSSRPAARFARTPDDNVVDAAATAVATCCARRNTVSNICAARDGLAGEKGDLYGRKYFAAARRAAYRPARGFVHAASAL